MENIVIIGGGAGGLPLAARLGARAKSLGCQVTLVDKATTHVWKPLLHEVAAGTFNPDAEGDDYLALAQKNGFKFEWGSLSRLDRAQKCIYLSPIYDEDGLEIIPERSLCYDKLVIAVGSCSNDFGIPGVIEHCYFLDNVAQGSLFQRKLWQGVMQHYYNPQCQGAIRVAIVGGGATGIELAAELYSTLDKIKAYGIMRSHPHPIMITLIEAGNRLAPALTEALSAQALHALVGSHIDVLLNTKITAVTAQGLQTHEGASIAADLIVWCAGVKAPEGLKSLDGLAVNRINQLKVTSTLRCVDEDAIWAIGDCAACVMADDKPVPPRALAAQQMATYLADQWLGVAATEVDYRYVDRGTFITLGDFFSLGNLISNKNNIKMTGWSARMMYLGLYFMHQVKLHGYWDSMGLTLAAIVEKSWLKKIKLH